MGENSMITGNSYGQFCPVAMAAEILCTRWTVLLLREMCAGSTRFNELRKGVPLMSPALLAKRLRQLEEADVVERVPSKQSGGHEYRLTPAGQELQPIIFSMGFWGQRWVSSQNTLKNLDPSLLMWDMRRNLNMTPTPDRQCTIQFLYPDLPKAKQKWWLVIDQGQADLCSVDPGFDVDLYVVSDLRTMTAIWMGLTTVQNELGANRLELLGDASLRKSMQTWLGLSPFAKERKQVAA
jgi:DNA-binding HxlR family transcriptional regulator